MLAPKAWQDFQDSVQVIKEEISRPDAEVEILDPRETPEVGYFYSASLSEEGVHAHFMIDARGGSKDVVEWDRLNLSLTIGYPDGNKTEKIETFTKRNQVPDITLWVRSVFFELNTASHKVDLKSLFGEADIRVWGIPGGDYPELAEAVIAGGSSVTTWPLEVYRFRHVNREGSATIDVHFSYAIRLDFAWIFFPDIAGLAGGGSRSALEKIETTIKALDDAKAEYKQFDCDYDELIRFLAKNAQHLNKSFDLIDKGEGSIDFHLETIALPAQVESKFKAELKLVSEAIWSGDYPDALRRQRVLVHHSLKELMKMSNLPFRRQDRIAVLAQALITRNVLDLALKEWFNAYPKFANPSSHTIYPTKEDLEDPIVSSRTNATLSLGKHLLYEIWVALRNSDPTLPRPVDLSDLGHEDSVDDDVQTS